MCLITASVVLFNTKESDLFSVISSFKPDKDRYLYLVDNSPSRINEETLKNVLSYGNIEYIFLGKNLGYGASHNIALKKAMEKGSYYHAVLNPDISFAPKIINELASVMEREPSIAHLMPKIVSQEGEVQHLCKLLPTPFDLIFRRFLPQNLIKRRMNKFELAFADYEKTMDVPYLSGCFMFLRLDALRQVGLFDERFFMYPEDIDLTRRLHRKYRTVYYPDVFAIHSHEKASYKNLKMLKIHIENMVKYFNKYGWFFDSERKEVNKKTLSSLLLSKSSNKNYTPPHRQFIAFNAKLERKNKRGAA